MSGASAPAFIVSLYLRRSRSTYPYVFDSLPFRLTNGITVRLTREISWNLCVAWHDTSLRPGIGRAELCLTRQRVNNLRLTVSHLD